jgi:RHS repeat-associated protein
MMQSTIYAFPEHMQKEMEKGMKHMLEKGPTPLGRTIMSNMGIDPDKMWGGMREGIRQIEQEKQTPVEIHFYHCDHLGTPIALTDRNGKIVWAARYDPWGNIEEEFNPHNIEQNIRLPGQHHDRETGLYYNRHRYYDPKIGAYINQDPIGLLGGVNFYSYPKNPLSFTDPKGLVECYVPSYDGPSNIGNTTSTAGNAVAAAARTGIGRTLGGAAVPVVDSIEPTGKAILAIKMRPICIEEVVNGNIEIAPQGQATPLSTEPSLNQKQKDKLAEYKEKQNAWDSCVKKERDARDGADEAKKACGPQPEDPRKKMDWSR